MAAVVQKTLLNAFYEWNFIEIFSARPVDDS